MGPTADIDGDPLGRHSLSPTELKQLLAAERAGEPFLVYRDGERRLSIFAAGPERETFTLGRRPQTDLSVNWDNEVSGLHAELQALGGEWTIVDDGLSTNGTFVNGRRVSGRERLRDGDRIRVGRTILAFKVGASPAVVQKTATAGTLPGPEQVTDTQRRVLIALCRPYRDGESFSTPATNRQIAAEVFLSVEAVKMHLRTLFGKFELAELAQNEKRARLAESALELGHVTQHDLA
ncbi:MAG TPA: FHA domain-containing protein [Solirubrobacteraceae bacterium]|nr:FHA domain-containing protein [Solirubrobacteraceae bacterium]